MISELTDFCKKRVVYNSGKCSERRNEHGKDNRKVREECERES